MASCLFYDNHISIGDRVVSVEEARSLPSSAASIVVFAVDASRFVLPESAEVNEGQTGLKFELRISLKDELEFFRTASLETPLLPGIPATLTLCPPQVPRTVTI